MNYTLDTSQVKTIEQVERLMQTVIKCETGAETEVTIRNEMMVYTEELDKAEVVKTLLSQTRTFIRASYYEADEDDPAGVTFTFSL